MRDFIFKEPQFLSKALLEELPRQFLEYMRINNILPGNGIYFFIFLVNTSSQAIPVVQTGVVQPPSAVAPPVQNYGPSDCI